MECTKFERFGLLYVSGELDEDEARRYEEHLEECPDCKRETEDYKSGRESLFSPVMLGENPPEAIDREILRVCAVPKKQYSFLLMPLIKKYAPVPVFLMLLMVAVGGYVRHHSMSADTMKAKLSPEAIRSEEVVEDDAPSVIDYMEVVNADSGTEDKSTPKTLGDMKIDGVVPVSGDGK